MAAAPPSGEPDGPPLAGGRSPSVAELGELIPGVPPATLYRRVGKLAAAGVLALVEGAASPHRDLELPYRRIASPTVDPEPLRSIRSKPEVGLRPPGIHYVCKAGWGRSSGRVRRGREALALTPGSGRLERVVVSAPDARPLAERAA